MKYGLYQIVLTEQRYKDWNAGEDQAGYKLYLNTTVQPTMHEIQKALQAGMYKRVAYIEATSYEDVFRVGNIGPEEQIERIDQMHSVSVGDIVIGEDGNQMFVASFGFKPVYSETI